MKKQLSFLLALALLLTSCGGGSGAAATTMRLRKTEGTVGVSDGEKAVEPRDDLGLYSGYGVDTRSESYAWIDLDSVKLTKLDQDSEIAITKDGKNLDIEVKSGSLFFNITEPLEDDESMNIRTSTMAIGIRGTCGWVTDNTAALLEGTVTVTAGEQEVTVSAGEMAVFTEEGTLEVKPFTAMTVPAFVKAELEEDSALAEAVVDASGIDVLNAPTIDFSDPMRLRDMYTYSRLLNYNENGKLFQRVEYFPDEQGRIGKNVAHYINPVSGIENSTSESEYIYDDAGSLLQNGSYTVTENTTDLRKKESVRDNGSFVYISYYDEQGRETREESIQFGQLAWYTTPTYDAEGKIIRSDRYAADGSLNGYVLYEYD